jgi:hypothetical protein
MQTMTQIELRQPMRNRRARNVPVLSTPQTTRAANGKRLCSRCTVNRTPHCARSVADLSLRAPVVHWLPLFAVEPRSCGPLSERCASRYIVLGPNNVGRITQGCSAVLDGCIQQRYFLDGNRHFTAGSIHQNHGFAPCGQGDAPRDHRAVLTSVRRRACERREVECQDLATRLNGCGTADEARQRPTPRSLDFRSYLEVTSGTEKLLHTQANRFLAQSCDRCSQRVLQTATGAAAGNRCAVRSRRRLGRVVRRLR